MKRTLTAITILFASLPLSPAPADARTPSAYIGGLIGTAIPSPSNPDFRGVSGTVDYSTAYMAGIQGGFMSDGMLRLESELSFWKLDTDTITVGGRTYPLDNSGRITSLMLNALLDFSPNESVSPYVGAGIGVVSVSVNDGYVGRTLVWEGDNDSTTAYQLLLGFGIFLTPQVTFDLGYRYLMTDELNFYSADMTFKSHALTIGLRTVF